MSNQVVIQCYLLVKCFHKFYLISSHFASVERALASEALSLHIYI